MNEQNYDENDIEEQYESESDKKPLLMEQLPVQSPPTSSKSDMITKQLSSAIYQYSTYRKNRRISRKSNDQWNRKYLCVIFTALVLIVYIFFVNQPSNEQQVTPIIVNVPPQDNTLPGPKESTESDKNTQMPYFNTETKTHNNTQTLSSSSSSTTTKTTTKKTLFYNHITTNLPEMNLSNLLQFDDVSVPSGYLVFNPQCKMPSLDPHANDVMKLFRQEKYENCLKTKPMTSIRMNWNKTEATLILDEKAMAKNMSCCYQEIERHGNGKSADAQFNLGHCIDFNRTTVLPNNVEFIVIRCKAYKETYVNTHAIIRERPAIRKRLEETMKNVLPYNENIENNEINGNGSTEIPAKKPRSLSVLLLSIDSISRLNLIRAMPKTAQHLYDHEWFELQGYNKIDDNTFPNLMAILTGYNGSLAYSKCAPHEIGKLDNCPMIWHKFRSAGYVTAYGEDEASISTFNYHKVGFKNPPTDYYMRPYMLAAEKILPIKRKHSLTFCLGYKHSADHIYEYAMDFATQYKKDPSFGLFWTNTFSHNDISDPSSMDQKIKDYLLTLDNRGILNESMVIFLSDHGIRFGPVRHLVTGWLEERLPFIFIWLPKWFRDLNPDIVEALKINRNRLTNPYDLHMTLKHVLELSGHAPPQEPSLSCPNCQSLFKEIPWNRSCDDISIASHWCTCKPQKSVDKDDPKVKGAANYVIDYMNDELKNDKAGKYCSKLKLDYISFARKAEDFETYEPHYDYMVVFRATPNNGWFESTVRYFISTEKYEITGSVSRLDMYGSQSNCMKKDNLKKFCYCNALLYKPGGKG